MVVGTGLDEGVWLRVGRIGRGYLICGSIGAVEYGVGDIGTMGVGIGFEVTSIFVVGDGCGNKAWSLCFSSSKSSG